MKKTKIPFVVIIVGAILIIGGVIFVLKYSSRESLLGINFGSKNSKISEENFKDSDNDGLRDWEEELFRTDPDNPDTDGDGYLDGEEVDSGHNPLVKAPGDNLSFYPLPLGEKYNVTNKILNEEAAHELMTSYLSQKLDYLENHPEIENPEQFLAVTDASTIQEMAKRSIWDSYEALMGTGGENISKLTEIFDISISDDQIKISEDNSKEAIKTYINNASEWLNSDVFFFQNEILQTIADAFKSQDFSNIDKLIRLNDDWIDRMKEIIVPSSWKEIHKEGFKTVILFRNILVSLRDYENDVFKAYYAADKLEELPNTWSDLIKQTIYLANEQDMQLPL